MKPSRLRQTLRRAQPSASGQPVEPHDQPGERRLRYTFARGKPSQYGDNRERNEISFVELAIASLPVSPLRQCMPLIAHFLLSHPALRVEVLRSPNTSRAPAEQRTVKFSDQGRTARPRRISVERT
jgi:hypothetical protein